MELTKEEAQPFASVMTLPTKAFIGGHFSDVLNGCKFETINQANGCQNYSANMCQIVATKIASSFLEKITAVAKACGSVGPLLLFMDTGDGLNATVFKKYFDRALHMAWSLLCVTIAVTGSSEGHIKTVFGGYKRLGSLLRPNGADTLSKYFHTKIIWICKGEST